MPRRQILQAIICKVTLSPNSISIELSRKALTRRLKLSGDAASEEQDDVISLTSALRLQRKGVEAKLVIVGQANVQQPDPDLCRLVAKAKHWFDQLVSGEAKSVQEIALHESVFVTEISRVLQLAFLAPNIVEDLLAGRQPESLTVRDLQRLRSLDHHWKTQRKQLGYPA